MSIKISGLPAALDANLTTAALVPVTDSASATVKATVLQMASAVFTANNLISVKSKGAVGDGITDDTAAIQLALNAMTTKGGVCFFPPGDYKVSFPLIPPGSNAFLDSSKHTISMHGARLLSSDPTAGRAVFDLSSYIGQEGSLTIEGGTLDGTNASATAIGVKIHSMNTVLRGVVVRNFGGTGVTWANDLAAPPICCSLVSCLIQKNGIGVWSTVPTSNLVLLGNRIEGNSSEGVYLDGCGKVTLLGNTIENNGFVNTTKANLRMSNAVDFFVSGNYFESNAYQGHSSVLVEGNSSANSGGAFLGNRVVGYYETSAGSGVALTASIGLDLAGGAAGAVESVICHGNDFAGQYTGVRINTNARGFSIGPDNFSDNFAPTFTTPTCIRYSIISSNPGVVYDMNRYVGVITPVGQTAQPGAFSTLATSGLHTAALGVKVTGGVSVDGSVVTTAAQGLCVRGIAGATDDMILTGPGGTGVLRVPTGTQTASFFKKVQSVDPTAGVGYGTGAGGTVTQATSKATGVTLNKVCGQITLNAAALAAATVVSFVLTNAAIAAGDVLILNHVATGTFGAYALNGRCAGGSATIDVFNHTGGSLSEAIVLDFAVLKAVTS